ncbi:hypothetical protein GCM10007875_01320 [Limnobacter litoralis]|uniref:Uncharacterized protein n=1 Tax=Limnobacter litoralis TaxID=481366 RepID=A0ABQ5YML6_9BURK|nr:hypothetical protein GCM10007875_01320 [Limnobacter litoralis]
MTVGLKNGHASGAGARLFEPLKGELRDRFLRATGNLYHRVPFAVRRWALNVMKAADRV